MWVRVAGVAAVVAVAVFVTSIILPVGSGVAETRTFKYPPAKKDNVTDDFHGTTVADPYRWLEDAGSPETIAWVDAENVITQEFIQSVPVRDGIEKRLTDIWNYPKYSLPYKHGDRYFFYKNDGLQNQSVLYVQETLTSDPKVVINPNTLSEDGTVAMRSTGFSENGKYLAYGLSESGSDWQKIYVRDIDTGKDFDEVLDWCKFPSLSWKHDHTGFYYNRLPEEGSVPPEDRNNYSKVYWHTLGTPQSEDVLIYEDPENKELGFYPYVTDDGKYLGLGVYHGTDPKNGLYYREIDSDGAFIKIVDIGVAKFDFIDNVGTTFFFNTDLDAPKGRVIAIDCSNANREHWKEIIPESADVIHYARMVNNNFIVAYMHDAHHKVKIFGQDGTFVRELELPTIGSVYGLSGEREDTEMFFGLTSFLYPTTAFHYDFAKNEVSVFRQPEIDFDASKYETKQVFYKSKDGTRVPMFITHKKGLQLNGDNPTILYGYGGFNASMTPYFSVTRLIWMENGGVYAIANIRGGDEYGEEWHQAGMLENKQNVFDDFIAGAEWLIENNYTNTERLAIMGGSNGGLLVAACMLQRPELFGAVVCQVPVTDMLRYHKKTVGRYWVPEYGNAEENPEHFKFLYAYSPLHNVKSGVSYPATLITTADTDDRVDPMHSKKFAATLQAADAGDNPILIRIETKAGHGGGKPTTKRIEEAADTYAFLFKVLDMNMTVVGQR